MADELYGIQAVARYLEKDPKQIYRWIARGIFPPGYKVKIDSNLELPPGFYNIKVWYKKDLDEFKKIPRPIGRPRKRGRK